MLFCKNITKSFGAQLLFSAADFQLNSGERLGMVGRNGVGKSTLFRVILGEDTIDDGEISFPENYKIGALDQHLVFSQKTILDEVAQSLPAEQKHDRWKAEKLLSGLGFSVADFSKSPDTFSGGFQIRVKLAELLLSEPNLLLLDEPTNYLDIVAIRWLERFLRSWKNEIICISHDQSFLEKISTHTLAVHRKKFKKIKGSPAHCFQQIQKEEELHERTRANQEKEEQKQKKFIREFRAGARSAGLVQSRIKMLEKRKSLDALSSLAPIRFQFAASSFTGAKIVDAHNISFGYERDTDLLKNLNFEILPGERIGIVGANGKGKSTLLKILNAEFPLKTGTLKVHQNAEIGYMGQSNIERLDPTKNILEEFQSVPGISEQMARNVAGNLLFSDSLAYKQIKILSGGEKARVNLGKIFLTPVNFLLLDEPTNHLDYESIESFISAAQKFPGAMIFVSHNESFLRTVAQKLIVFDGDSVFFYPHNYETFLQEKGFQSEQEPDANSVSPVISKNHKNLRENKKERDRLLRPLKRKFEKIEEKILQLEDSQKKNVEQFKIAERQGNRLKMDTLGIQYQNFHQKLETCWEEWNAVAEELQKIEDLISSGFE
ncbi:ABC-F family ATP-binding cassette domain-containing protein [bacterium]|jgi:ATP-binding cassette, subfamily F, member 3|nr:ABC-F family ATP-binding cassette domain-containing protein [bacterium]MBT6832257.1 ABC-F family ATP-binding cassette domain-containing protein [bacterium]MBT6996194.1 ABC-F family ATP-binding cassette domain-containing protein [bacterium]MBT7772441.1 ABC-F family ATP-binding cassette domain-containing protein [bacterium]